MFHKIRLLTKRASDSVNDPVREHMYFTYLVLSIPMIWGGISQRLFDMTDLFWITRLGSSAVTAASVSSSIGLLTFFLCFIVSNGVQVPLAKAWKNDKKEYESLRATAVMLVGLLSLLFTVLLFVFAESILGMVVINTATTSDMIIFLKIYALGLPAQMYFNYFSRVLSVEKSTKYLSRSRFVALILNFILDPILILGVAFIPGIGVAGAALTSIITKAWSAIYVSARYKNKVFPSAPIRFSHVKEIIILGFPPTILAIAKPLVGVLFIRAFSAHGSEAIAAYGISNRIFNIVFLFVTGLDITLTTELTRSIASGDTRPSSKSIISALLVSSTFLCGFLLIAIASSGYMAQMMTTSDSLAHNVEFFFNLRLLAIPALVGIVVFQAALKASKRPGRAMLSGIIPIVATALLISQRGAEMDATEILLLMASSMTLEAVIAMLAYFHPLSGGNASVWSDYVMKFSNFFQLKKTSGLR